MPTGRLVIPGLVDTHRHVWQGAIAAYTPQITGAGYEPIVLAGISPDTRPKTSTPARCGERCKRSTPASQRSPTGHTTSSRLNTPMPTCAACRNPASAAISFTEAQGRKPTNPTLRTRKTRAGCATSTSQTA